MTRSYRSARVGNLAAAARLMGALDRAADDPVARQRRLVADLCRMLDPTPGRLNGNGNGHSSPEAAHTNGKRQPPNGDGPRPPVQGLSPRMHQTLQRLLAGDSEKQIAQHLDRSPHTIHVYVKQLYRHFGVCSRGELLACFVNEQGAGERAMTSGH